MKKSQLIGGVIVLIIIAGGAFYAGTAYGKGQTPVRGNGQSATSFNGMGMGRMGRGAGGGFTAGQIISNSNGSITIQSVMSSSTEIVLVSNTTQVFKTVSGGLSDLTPGTNVVVTGSANSDGSMTAQSIQVRPAGITTPGAR